LTFARAAEKVGDGDSGRSRMPTDDRHKFGAERLHPTTTNWRYRPFSDLGSPLLDVREPTLNVCRRAQASHGRPCSVGVNARSLDVTIVAGRAKPPSATAQIRVRNDVSGVASAPRAHNSTQPLQHVAE
jgi:hypothetical protein